MKTRGDHRTALCDFDRQRPPSFQRLESALRLAGVRASYISIERSHARGWHARIGLNRRLSSAAIVALQFALGSDPAREGYNLFRVTRGAAPRDWNLLFRRKLI